MKRALLTGVAFTAMGLFNAAQAADANMPAKVPAACRGAVDPYKNYACLDDYLGTTFLERFFNYYRLEWGHDVGARRSEGAAVAPSGERGPGDTGDDSSLSVHRVALRRHHQPWRDAAEFG